MRVAGSSDLRAGFFPEWGRRARGEKSGMIRERDVRRPLDKETD